MAEGFALRHRAIHVPDFVRRLEIISKSPRSPSIPSSKAAFRSSSSILQNVGQEEEEFASVVSNLTVWIDAQVSKCAFHAGFDKIRLYVAFYEQVVAQWLPYAPFSTGLDRIKAYIGYLTTTVAAKPPSLVRTKPPKRSHRLQLPAPMIKQSIAPLLSPRAAQMLLQSPRSSPQSTAKSMKTTKPRRMIEMTDHEVAILEVALYYDEVLTTKKPKTTDLHATPRWFALASATKTNFLWHIKRKLSKQTFFASVQSIVGPVSPLAAKHPPLHRKQAPVPAAMRLSSYFALVMLCLHETLRRLSTFSIELAEFANAVLGQQALETFERMFASVILHQTLAQDGLQTLKQQRVCLQDGILQLESEIARLQAQNVRSLSVWHAEKEEMTRLEHEEQWHGHCKSLMLDSLAQLRQVANLPTWLQRATTDDQEEKQLAPTENLSTIDYERLPAGAALFHFRHRFQMVYMAHLILLCRSYLHLHERKTLQEVMLATSITRKRSLEELTQHPLLHEAETIVQEATMATQTPTSTVHNPMEKISLSELHTLREINDALRAIETLYAATEATQHHPSHNSVDRQPRPLIEPRQRHVSTQYPDLQTMRKGSSSYLRSLSYLTIAATAFTTASTIVPRSPKVETTPGNKSPKARSESVHGSPSIPRIRLYKAHKRLPKHMKNLLVSFVLEDDPFPMDSPISVTFALTKDEILDRIRWIYGLVLENAYASSSTTSAGPTTSTLTASHVPVADWLPISLSKNYYAGAASGNRWSSEEFVEFIYAGFLDQTHGRIKKCEREFIRFFASIQLLLSSASYGNTTTSTTSAAVVPPSAAAASGLDAIQFFATLVRLYYIETADGDKKMTLPMQVFAVFFYCLRVLAHVAITKKMVPGPNATSIEIWSVSTDEFVSQTTNTRRVHVSASVSASVSPSSGAGVTNPPLYVLLESVKTLLVYLLTGTAPDIAHVLEERFQFLSERTISAQVALSSPLTPASYQVSSSSSGSSTTASFGQLSEVLILPLDFVLPVILTAWLDQHEKLQRRLSISMQSTLTNRDGGVSLEEFIYLMTTNATLPHAATSTPSSSAPTATASLLSTARLTKIYTATSPHNKPRKWKELVQMVLDDVDFMGMHEKFTNVDFRSIQQALHAASSYNSSNMLSHWVQHPIHRTGDTASFQRAWEALHPSMKEQFTLACQAENAIDGVRCWQLGSDRFAKVQQLYQQTTTKSNDQEDEDQLHELSPTALDVAWKSFHLLQLELTRANHFADQVRLKQQRQQKQSFSPSSPSNTSPTGTSSYSLTFSSAKADETRATQPTTSMSGSVSNGSVVAAGSIGSPLPVPPQTPPQPSQARRPKHVVKSP